MLFILVQLLFKKFVPETENQFTDFRTITHMFHSYDIAMNDETMCERVYAELLQLYTKEELHLADVFEPANLKAKMVISKEI